MTFEGNFFLATDKTQGDLFHFFSFEYADKPHSSYGSDNLTIFGSEIQQSQVLNVKFKPDGELEPKSKRIFHGTIYEQLGDENRLLKVMDIMSTMIVESTEHYVRLLTDFEICYPYTDNGIALSEIVERTKIK